MGTKRVGLARIEALIENLKRDLDLSTNSITLTQGIIPNYSNAEGVSASTVTWATATHNGQPMICTGGTTVTLPAVAAGMSVWIVNGAADGTILTVSPNASDAFFFNAAGASGTDNKDVVNTALTAKKGDFIKCTYHAANKWRITEIGGTWADQA